MPSFSLHLGQKCVVSYNESMKKGMQMQIMTGGNMQKVIKRSTKNTAHPSLVNLLTVFVLISLPHSGHTISIGLEKMDRIE